MPITVAQTANPNQEKLKSAYITRESFALVIARAAIQYSIKFNLCSYITLLMLKMNSQVFFSLYDPAYYSTHWRSLSVVINCWTLFWCMHSSKFSLHEQLIFLGANYSKMLKNFAMHYFHGSEFKKENMQSFFSEPPETWAALIRFARKGFQLIHHFSSSFDE